MTLKQLEILNYKNISEANLTFSPNINCFIGRNGEGKTNLLDAIYFLSFTKSATNHIDSMNLRHGEDIMMLRGIYELNEAEEEIQCGLRRGQAKQFRRNKKLYKKLSEHIGLLPAILVSPSDTNLILGGSEERRRFIDIVISQYNKDYINSLNRYDKALLQRNSILKNISEGKMPDANDELLAIYEEVMAVEGEKIYKERKTFIDTFIPIFQNYYSRISCDNETVNLDYISHCQRGPLLKTIQEGRAKDKIMGYSLHGIHKDDLEMTLRGYPIKKEGSQGQNKTYLISLKLAQFNFLRETGSHTTPLLLLDDIFDKLDAQRVEQIISLASDEHFGQIFITDTNREHIDQILRRTGQHYHLFTVASGAVSLATE